MSRSMTGKIIKSLKGAQELYYDGHVLNRQELKMQVKTFGATKVLNEISVSNGVKLIPELTGGKINTYEIIEACLDKLAVQELVLPSKEEWEKAMSKVERTEEELTDELLQILVKKNKGFVSILREENADFDADDDVVFDTWFSEMDEYLKILKRYVIDYLPDGYDQNL